MAYVQWYLCKARVSCFEQGRILKLTTELRDQHSASLSGGAGFKSRHGHQLPGLRVFVIFLSPCRKFRPPPLFSTSFKIHDSLPFFNLTPFFSMTLPAQSGPWPLTEFRNHFSQTAGFLGRLISSSQGRYLHAGNINTEQTHTHTKHLFLQWGWNPRSQRPNERRQFMP
jgi:hypothetical protein